MPAQRTMNDVLQSLNDRLVGLVGLYQEAVDKKDAEGAAYVEGALMMALEMIRAEAPDVFDALMRKRLVLN